MDRIWLSALCIYLSLLTACSPVMEATRPDPVDMSEFQAGQSRAYVSGALGRPVNTVQDAEYSCDTYRLYTRGPGTASKSVIAVLEAAADVFTLCLAELLMLPTELATKNSKHNVVMCYGKDDKLATIKDSGPSPSPN